MSAEYPDFHAVYVEQVVQHGTADAIRLAEPFVQEDCSSSSWTRSSTRTSRSSSRCRRTWRE